MCDLGVVHMLVPSAHCCACPALSPVPGEPLTSLCPPRPSLASPCPLPLPLSARAPGEEAALLVRLREVLYAQAAPFILAIPGWHTSNPTAPCRWDGVTCDADNRVTRL